MSTKLQVPVELEIVPTKSGLQIANKLITWSWIDSVRAKATNPQPSHIPDPVPSRVQLRLDKMYDSFDSITPRTSHSQILVVNPEAFSQLRAHSDYRLSVGDSPYSGHFRGYPVMCDSMTPPFLTMELAAVFSIDFQIPRISDRPMMPITPPPKPYNPNK